MPTHADREHFVPLRIPELVDFLVTGKGAKTEPRALSIDEQNVLAADDTVLKAAEAALSK